MSRFTDFLDNIFFPNEFTCICCDTELVTTSKLGYCASCAKHITPIQGDEQCLKCGTYLPTMAEHCYNCQRTKRHFDICRAAVCYDGTATSTIFKLKSQGGGWIGKFFARAMYKKYLNELAYQDAEYSLEADLVIPMPVHKKRLKELGHNHSADIAKHLANLIGLPFCKNILKKAKETPKQALTPSAKVREKNLRNSFEVVDLLVVKGKTVLLVDDIITTGATLSEAARTLRRAGAKRVVCMTYAATVNPMFKVE